MQARDYDDEALTHMPRFTDKATTKSRTRLVRTRSTTAACGTRTLKDHPAPKKSSRRDRERDWAIRIVRRYRRYQAMNASMM